MKRYTFFVYTPFTGLGLYGGFRGNRWLRNRIKIFKQFVIPSLLNQSDRNFVHWISWRPEERTNPHVRELAEWLSQIPNYRFVFTYDGIAIWDDKHPEEVAREKLFQALHRSLPELFDYAPDCEEIYWLLQPSDDLYSRDTILRMVYTFQNQPQINAITYMQGFLCNYNTKEVLEYNPKTNPPFCAMRFPRETFFDPSKYMSWISLKTDAGPYKAGTPYPSHEYLKECLATGIFDWRGFMVGTHGENISTHFNHPYGGARFEGAEKDTILDQFGIGNAEVLDLPFSLRKWILRQLPHRVRRKFRYWFGELIASRVYEWIRS